MTTPNIEQVEMQRLMGELSRFVRFQEMPTYVDDLETLFKYIRSLEQDHHRLLEAITMVDAWAHDANMNLTRLESWDHIRKCAKHTLNSLILK